MPFTWRNFIHFTIAAACNMSLVSMFVLIQQYSSFISPYTFLTVFCLNILSAFVSFVVVAQPSEPQVSVGHIKVLCTFSLVFQDRCFDLKNVICVK